MVECEHHHQVVVALDFGTTYSGYAFQHRHEYENDSLKVCAFVNWISNVGVISQKTPTSILLSPDKEFLKFGHEAEDKFCELASEGKHHSYYFFRRFKMLLHRNKNLNRDTKLADFNGKELPAKVVFGHAISYLKNHALSLLTQQGTGFEDWEVHWVLTVPAIWTEASKQFMREAAQKADITNDQLTIALEPEAASILCRRLPDAKGSTAFKTGEKYMVVDMGGGTVDITVHQVEEGDCLRELHIASGGAWGGIKVDHAYEQLLIDIVGERTWEAFRKKHSGDHFEMLREFELKKRSVRTEMPENTAIKFPLTLKEIYEATNKGKSFKDAVDGNESYSGDLKLLGDKIKIKSELLQGLFYDPIDKIVEHIRRILLVPIVRGTKTFLLVGGLSESDFVQNMLKSKFPNTRMIIPPDAGLSVLKGAAIYGHAPKTIRSRIAKQTYGIAISKPYIEGHHPPEKRMVTANGVMCKDIFHKYVESGESVEIGDFQAVPFTMARGSSSSRVRVYCSEELDPIYVTDDGCKLLGELIINLGNADIASSCNVSVTLTFGGTEITVEAKENNTGQIFRSRFDFLTN